MERLDRLDRLNAFVGCGPKYPQDCRVLMGDGDYLAGVILGEDEDGDYLVEHAGGRRMLWRATDIFIPRGRVA